MDIHIRFDKMFGEFMGLTCISVIMALSLMIQATLHFVILIIAYT